MSSRAVRFLADMGVDLRVVDWLWAPGTRIFLD